MEDNLVINPAMLTEKALGHEAATSDWLQAFSGGRPAHSWLLAGPKGVGKSTWLYERLRCLFAGADVDANHPIARRMQQGSHADVRIVQPEEAGKPIKVEAIRELHGFLRMTAAESQWRAVVIEPAEAMNVNAANALLKLLEEPPAHALLFLVTHAPGRLLPTIRSRCRMVRFGPLAGDVMQQLADVYLPSVGRDDWALLTEMAQGSIGQALALYEDDMPEFYRRALALPTGAEGDALALKLANEVSDKANPQRWALFQRWVAFMLHQLVVAQQNGHALPEVMQWSLRQSAEQWLALWDESRKIFEDTASLNLDKKQAALSILFQMQRV